MKHLRLFLVVVLSASIVLAGCGTQPTQTAQRAFTGEELYRAFFFLEGPAAAYLPDAARAPEAQRLVSELSQDEQDALTDARNRIVTALVEQDESFFTHFAQELQSGNPVRVERVLQNAFEATETVGQQLFSHIDDDTPIEIQVCGPLWCVLVAGIAVAIAVAVVNYGAAAHSVHQWLAVTEDVAVPGSDSINSPKRITHDRTIAQISELFAVQ